MSNIHVALADDVPAQSSEPNHAYVDWAAILAGAFVAAAISTVMTAFGTALGLSVASPVSGSSLSGAGLAAASGLWVLWIAISSFIAGGYLAGRMRRRAHDASEHESDVRDGAHGLVVWAIGALLLAYVATSSVAGVARGVASLGATGAAAIGADGAQRLIGGASDGLTSKLFRSTTNANPAPDNLKKETFGVLSSALASGALSPEDKDYLTAK